MAEVPAEAALEAAPEEDSAAARAPEEASAARVPVAITADIPRIFIITCITVRVTTAEVAVAAAQAYFYLQSYLF